MLKDGYLTIQKMKGKQEVGKKPREWYCSTLYREKFNTQFADTERQRQR